jgi:hypothetical protein
MPSDKTIDALPKPNDSGVKFSETEEKYVVAIQFGGWADDQKIAKNAQVLIDTLNARGVKIASEPWYMGYDPPFQLVNRRNEVAVQVTKEQLELLKSL